MKNSSLANQDNHTQMLNENPPTKGSWSKTEDEKLMAIVEELGGNVRNWTDISKKMVPFNRTPKQCRERYHQNLKPNLNKDPITEEEGEKINQMVIKHGKKWAFIARSLNNGRSDNTVKNWWNLKEGKKKRMKAKLEKKKINNSKPIENPKEEEPKNDVPSNSNNLPIEPPIMPEMKLQPTYINGLNMNHNYEWMSNELAKSNLIGMPSNNFAHYNLRLYESNVNRNSIFNQNIFNSNPTEPSPMDGAQFMKNGMNNSFSDLTKYSMQPVPQFMNGRMHSVDHFIPNTLNYSPASNGSNNDQRRISVAHSALSASNNLPMMSKEEDRGNRTRESSILALNQTPTNNILPISRRASQFFLQQQSTDIMNDKYRQNNIIFKQPFLQGVPQNNTKISPQALKNNFSTLGFQNKPENGVFKSDYTMNQTSSKDDRRRSTLANILNNDPE